MKGLGPGVVEARTSPAKHVFGGAVMTPAAMFPHRSHPGGFPMTPVGDGGIGPYGVPTGMDVEMLHAAATTLFAEAESSAGADEELEGEAPMEEGEVDMIALTEGPGEFWGMVNTPRGRRIARKIYMAGEDGLQVTLTNYGARIISVRMPDMYGSSDEVVVGLDNLTDYELVKDYKLGCVVGRLNCPLIGVIRENGFSNFEEMVWETHLKSASHVVFSLHSLPGEQDYPGSVLATCEYSLEPGNQLSLRLAASSDKETPLGLSTRVPFNLAGQDSGWQGLYEHRLMINSRKFLQHDKDKMLTGEVRRSMRHGLSFLAPTLMEKAFAKGPDEGFNHHLLLNGFPTDGLRFIARLNHRATGRSVEIYSNTQCLHLDTLNDLTVPERKEEIYDEKFEEEGVEEEQLFDMAEIRKPQYSEVKQPSGDETVETGLGENEEGSEDESSETWGEEQQSTTVDVSEAGEISLGMVDDLSERIRDPYTLSKRCGIVLAPEDYPDTIFYKKKFTLEPGETYERLIRFTFTTEQPPKLTKGDGGGPDPAGAGDTQLAGASV